MGLVCTRALPPPGWERIRADLEEAVHAGGERRDGPSFAGLPRGEDDVEVLLGYALRVGDVRLIEQACTLAEGRGLEKAKLSLARAEAGRLRASSEAEGLDQEQPTAPGDETRPPETKNRQRSSMDGPREFLAKRATMCAAVAVLGYEWTAYNLVYLGRILPTLGKESFRLPFATAFNILWVLAVWSFLMAHCTDGGRVPQKWYEFVHRMGNALPTAPPRLEWQPGAATFCRRCQDARPERAHHCHVCGVCVLRMDHHCPWIDNCVGVRNHKFFLLLVGYCFLSSLVALATSTPELVHCVAALVKVLGGGPWEDHLRLGDVFVFLIFSVLALVFLALLAPMVSTHFELASCNVTTIEAHYDTASMSNPYDLGNRLSNYEEIFGAWGFDWLLPVSPSCPKTDGISFVRAGLCDLPMSQPLIDSSCDVGAYTAEEQLWRLRYQVGARAGGDPRTRRPSRRHGGFQWWWWSASHEPSSRDATTTDEARRPPPRAAAPYTVLLDDKGRRIVSI